MDYENTDISKTLKKHMGSNSRKGKIVLAVSGTLIFMFCIALGTSSIIHSDIKKTQYIKVSDFCASTVQGGTCTFTIALTKMENPLFIYFDYENWFTSYFIYWKSMLMGDFATSDLPGESRNSCFPIKTYKDFSTRMTDLGLKKVPAAITAGLAATPNDNVYPCGLKAGIYSNMDSFAMADPSGNNLEISTKGLYYHRYKDYIKKRTGTWTDTTDERYISWMIPAINAYGTKFLYGKIEKDLMPGTYTITMVLNLKSSNVNYVPKIQLLSDIMVLANRELGIILLCSGFLAVAITVLTFVLKVKLKRH